MKPRPLSITIIGWLFIATGVVTLLAPVVKGIWEGNAQTLFEFNGGRLGEFALIGCVRMIAILGGVLLLYGISSSRWLLTVWMAFHFVLSFWHSTQQVVVHGVLFTIILFFLFRPSANAFFSSPIASKKDG
jgi:hypothetical protein